MFWAMVIPSAMGVWNVILTKTYGPEFHSFEIYESASIDGCSDWKYFTSMVFLFPSHHWWLWYCCMR